MASAGGAQLTLTAFFPHALGSPLLAGGARARHNSDHGSEGAGRSAVDSLLQSNELAVSVQSAGKRKSDTRTRFTQGDAQGKKQRNGAQNKRNTKQRKKIGNRSTDHEDMGENIADTDN